MMFTYKRKQKLLYQIAPCCGFYSNYNNMVLAILYCQKHNIEFCLCSKHSNIAYKKGWQDYFLPFCEETDNRYDTMYCGRFRPWPRKKDWPKLAIYKTHLWLHNINLLTPDVFWEARRQPLYPNIVDDCRAIDRRIYRFNENTKREIEKYASTVDLSNPFISMHIRRGDKKYETHNVTPLEKYFEEAAKQTDIRRCFISSDDYSVIEEAKERYPEWDIQTISKPEDRGYNQSEYDSLSKDERRESLILLFANIEIMAKAEYFFGTLSSNMGMYMYWRMPDGHCIGVDFKEWKIWYSV